MELEGGVKIGDVIPMNGFTAAWEGVSLSYKVKRGSQEQYAFLFLGVGSPERKLNANLVMKSLGWVHPTIKDTVAAGLDAFQKDPADSDYQRGYRGAFIELAKLMELDSSLYDGLEP